jgi:hypothetical protein
MAPFPSFAGECGVKWIASSSGNATAALKPQSIKAGVRRWGRFPTFKMWGKLGRCSPISWYFMVSQPFWLGKWWENRWVGSTWDSEFGTSLSMESLEYHLAALEWRDRPVTCQFAVMVGPKSRRDPPIIMENNWPHGFIEWSTIKVSVLINDEHCVLICQEFWDWPKSVAKRPQHGNHARGSSPWRLADRLRGTEPWRGGASKIYQWTVSIGWLGWMKEMSLWEIAVRLQMIEVDFLITLSDLESRWTDRKRRVFWKTGRWWSRNPLGSCLKFVKFHWGFEENSDRTPLDLGELPALPGRPQERSATHCTLPAALKTPPSRSE